MKLWVVGRTIHDSPEGIVWDLQGIFSTKKAAESACLDESYFIGPADLNEVLPHETVEWPDAYRPIGIVT